MSPDGPTVTTSAGVLRGRRTAHGAAFLGVPYAAPPEASGTRFRRPVPHEPWDGERDATRRGPTCPQPARVLPGVDMRGLYGDGWVHGDEWLNLNVWTPALPGGAAGPVADSGSEGSEVGSAPDAEPGGPAGEGGRGVEEQGDRGPATGEPGLPVMVWVHGGAFVAGSGAHPIYDGERFARDGVLCVTVNYRLGVEGFGLLEGGESNVGLHDVLAALRWVRDEIAAFGGDPGRVTVAGESAGAMAVCVLLALPAAAGLFSRAISQSGGAALVLNREQAARVSGAVAERLGVPATREAFLQRTPYDVVQAGDLPPGTVSLDTDEGPDPSGGVGIYGIVRDGDLVPEGDLPIVALREAASPVGPAVDLLIGHNLEEGNLYLAGTPGYDEMDDAAARGFVARLHPEPDAVLAAHRAERPELGGGPLMAQVLGDVVFTQPTRHVCEAHAAHGRGRTFAYELAWRSTGLGGRLGAGHAVDVPFVFDALASPHLTGPEGLLGDAEAQAASGAQGLADRMHAAWVSFVSDGEPGWTTWDAERRATMRFDRASGVVEDPRPGVRAAWAVLD